MQADGRLPFPVADAILDDPADVTRIDGEELARRRTDASFGSTSSVMRSSVHPSASAIIAIDSVKPTCRTRAFGHLFLELLGRQAGADFLLERQTADPRVLNAVHDDTIDASAHRREGDRQARPSRTRD